MTLDINSVVVCQDHESCVVIHSGNDCPLCTTGHYRNLYRDERDKLGRENNDLCDKIFDMGKTIQKLNSALTAQKNED